MAGSHNKIENIRKLQLEINMWTGEVNNAEKCRTRNWQVANRCETHLFKKLTGQMDASASFFKKLTGQIKRASFLISGTAVRKTLIFNISHFTKHPTQKQPKKIHKSHQTPTTKHSENISDKKRWEYQMLEQKLLPKWMPKGFKIDQTWSWDLVGEPTFPQEAPRSQKIQKEHPRIQKWAPGGSNNTKNIL